MAILSEVLGTCELKDHEEGALAVLVSKRAQERCNAPTNLPPASALCLRTPAPRRSNDVKKLQRG